MYNYTTIKIIIMINKIKAWVNFTKMFIKPYLWSWKSRDDLNAQQQGNVQGAYRTSTGWNTWYSHLKKGLLRVIMENIYTTQKNQDKIKYDCFQKYIK